jgi:RNA polymerase-binding transcription factor
MLRIFRPFHLAGMTDLQVEQLRIMLRAKEALLEQALGRREGIAVERSADPADDALLALDRELNIRALDRESGVLSAVRLALERIGSGTYGVCQCCEGTISVKRLVAVPWAVCCVVCQESIDGRIEKQELFAA